MLRHSILLCPVRESSQSTDMSNALRVLGVCELLQIVADNLTPQDLASFAQVSHLVSERSLDLLWKCLPTAIPLLALLPAVVFLNGQHVCFLLFVLYINA